MANLSALINDMKTPDLSRLSDEDVCKVLKARATVLDVNALSLEWQRQIATQAAGMVSGLLVPGKFGREEVIVCQSTWTCYEPNRDAFTMSEYDWLLVEVNLLWRRADASSSSTGKSRAKIPFVCRFCNADMVDKANLGWHRQMDMCPVYEASVSGRLKIYPSRGQDGNKESRAVFKKYNVAVPWQMMGKHMRPKAAAYGRGVPVLADSDSVDDQDMASQQSGDDVGPGDLRDLVHLSSPSQEQSPPPRELPREGTRRTSQTVRDDWGPTVAEFLKKKRKDRKAPSSAAAGGPTPATASTQEGWGQRGGGLSAVIRSGARNPNSAVHVQGASLGGLQQRGATTPSSEAPRSAKRPRREGTSEPTAAPATKQSKRSTAEAPPAGPHGPSGRAGKRQGQHPGAPLERMSPPGFRVDTAKRVRTMSLPTDPDALRRFQCQQAAEQKCVELFPGIDPASAPLAPPPPPGLYCLVQQSGDIIPLETLADLHGPVEALRSLQAIGQLARKVAAAWGSLQFNPELMDGLPRCVLHAVDRCKTAFVKKSAEEIDNEIDAFYLHHDDVLSFAKRKREFEENVRQVDDSRKNYVAEEMARFDLGVQMEVEAKEWGWSPLWAEFACIPTPRCIQRPFFHTEDEFRGLLMWFREEGNRIGDTNSPPHMARALKLFARSEIGGGMPMLCPVCGVTEESFISRPQQIMFAMEEFIRVGRIFFPSLDTTGDDFHEFRLQVDCGDNQGGQVARFTAWRRTTFVRACLDMVALDQVQVLRDMWVRRNGVDCEAVCKAFRTVLLLRENIDLDYCLGSVECTGVWPAAGEEFVDAARAMQRESGTTCEAKLGAWNLSSDVEDLEDFRASQLLCTLDAARFTNDGPTGSAQSVGATSAGQFHGVQPAGQFKGANLAGQFEEAATSGQVEDIEPEKTSCTPVVV